MNDPGSTQCSCETLPEVDWKAEVIHQLFESQAEKTPDAVALIDGGRQLSYRELDEQANRLANHLVNGGLALETPVGVLMERSTDLVTAILAILKAGGVYVPLDTSHPQQRVNAIVADTRMPVAVTNSSMANRLASLDLQLIVLDEVSEEMEATSSFAPIVDVGPDNLAYLVYTSGSTGDPKGVMIPHRVFTRFDYWARKVFNLTTDERFLFKSVRAPEELLFPLFIGAAAVIAPQDAERDPALLVRMIIDNDITAASISPSILSLLLDQDDIVRCRSLKKVFCSGEILPPDLRDRALSRLSAKLYNCYGLAEAPFSTYALCSKNDKSSASPIGHPVDAAIHLLDTNFTPVPEGEVGELYIGGPGLARGYLNRADLTTERFLSDRLLDCSPIYKTGDLAYKDKNAGYVLTGRSDVQVKVRGFRLEPGEVEVAIRRHPEVTNSSVLLTGNGKSEGQLTAYLTLRPNATITVRQLRLFLENQIPDYAVPSRFVVVPTFPVTTTGKLDRNQLAKVPGTELLADAIRTGPRNETERCLVRIWEELLERDRIGIHDNFFDLGGHSLLAARLILRIRSSLRSDLPVRSIFETPTIAQLVSRLAKTNDLSPDLVPVSRHDDLPLSFAQEQLWFLHELEPESLAYHIPEAFLLSGSIDEDLIEVSLERVISRHEVLRTRCRSEAGRPRQVVTPNSVVALEKADLSELQSAQKQEALNKLVVANLARTFNLGTGPLVRVMLVRLEVDQYLLLLNVHHIVSDEWSLGILYRELSECYTAELKQESLELRAPKIQYGDYAVWQRLSLRGAEFERQLLYWRRQLDGIATLQLSTDRPRPSKQTYAGSKLPFVFPSALTSRLEQFDREVGITPFMTLLAAFQVLLGRYSSQKDIVVGTPVSNRSHLELEKLIGFFVNTLVLRLDLSGDPDFHEIVHRVKTVALDAYEHKDLPFEKLVEALNPRRDLSRHPLFQVLFTVQNAPARLLSLPGIDVSPYALPTTATHFDLELTLVFQEGKWVGDFIYNVDLFDRETIERMSNHYLCLLESMLANPGQSVAEAPMLTERENRKLVVDWNATRSIHSSEKCVHQLFEEQVERDPNATAVIDRDRRISYRELDVRANQLAHDLRDRGVRPETLVGVSLERSIDMVVSLLGILKAGGAYVPIDPSYPKERFQFVVEDSGIEIVVTQKRLLAPLSFLQATVVDIEGDRGDRDTAKPHVSVAPDNLAYVIYTSGSTGRPKGVAIEHRNTVSLLHWAHNHYDQRELSGVLASTSISFDLSVFEIFVPLTCGGKVILAENILHLPALLAREEVTLVNTVPSGMAELIHAGGLPKSVITVNLAGEPLKTQLVNEIYKWDSVAKVYDLYGPSEDTTYSTCALRRPDETPTIGRPIANKQAYILDGERQLAPIGAPGELYLGGEGVARGYLNRPELTAERFVSIPLADGVRPRLYRTGDLCRYRADGRIEFLGRMDHQIKIRGFRVELGEIESTLIAHPEVKECVVQVKQIENIGEQLVAYFTPRAPKPVLEADQLRIFLLQKLPTYMVPAMFVSLEDFPRTPNGKIDKSALPVPDYQKLEDASEENVLRDVIERRMAEVWQKALGVAAIGRRDNFFELGGHSLLAARVTGDINKAFSVRLPLTTIFLQPTIRELSTAIRSYDGWRTGEPGLISPPIGKPLPFVFWAPSIGSVERFVECHNLMRLMKETCYFFGFDPAPAFEDIRSLAQHCVRLMRAKQPRGPYAVVGYCHCGHVAYEIARQLDQLGEQVKLLAVIDCSARDFAPDLRQRYYWLRERLTEDPRQIAVKLGARIRKQKPVIKSVVEGTPESQFSIHPKAVLKHRVGKFGGRLVLFYSEEFMASKRRVRLGWEALARKIDAYRASSAHSSLLREPAVSFIAAKLEQYLREIDPPPLD